MAYRELTMIDIKEVLRRWLAGHAVRQIAREGGVDRKTVRRYVHAAQVCELEPVCELSDELVHQVALRVQSRTLPAPSEQRSQLLERREQLRDWLEAEEPLRLSKVHVLLERRGVQVSYSTLRRFAIEELGWRKRPVTVRLDDPPPGQEAQADFGRLGMIVDPATGKRRTVWALIVTLSFSRHMFVWPTYRQTTEAVCEGLEAAWRFFDGVVARLVVDNLKPVVTRPDPLSPTISQAFLDYAQARDLFTDPARVRHPKDKPRVENQVPYVRESFFAGEDFHGLEDVQARALAWCLEVAGTRVHGTTRQLPLPTYEQQEKPHMKPAPVTVFDVPHWADAKVHPDHHVQVLRALYSLPTRYIGERVRVRADSRTVRIYLGTGLIKVHPRMAPGKRSTDPDDYPKGKSAYAFRNVDELIERAHKRSEIVGAFAFRLLEGPLPWTRMRQAYALLRLCDKYGAARVEAACRRALAFDVLDVRRIERMLKTALVDETQAVERGKLVQLPLPARFARSTDSFETRGRGSDDEEESR